MVLERYYYEDILETSLKGKGEIGKLMSISASAAFSWRFLEEEESTLKNSPRFI